MLDAGQAEMHHALTIDMYEVCPCLYRADIEIFSKTSFKQSLVLSATQFIFV